MPALLPPPPCFFPCRSFEATKQRVLAVCPVVLIRYLGGRSTFERDFVDFCTPNASNQNQERPRQSLRGGQHQGTQQAASIRYHLSSLAKNNDHDHDPPAEGTPGRGDTRRNALFQPPPRRSLPKEGLTRSPCHRHRQFRRHCRRRLNLCQSYRRYPPPANHNKRGKRCQPICSASHRTTQDSTMSLAGSDTCMRWCMVYGGTSLARDDVSAVHLFASRPEEHARPACTQGDTRSNVFHTTTTDLVQKKSAEEQHRSSLPRSPFAFLRKGCYSTGFCAPSPVSLFPYMHRTLLYIHAYLGLGALDGRHRFGLLCWSEYRRHS